MVIAAFMFRNQTSFKEVLLFMAVIVVGYALVVYLWDRWTAYRTSGWMAAVATVSTVGLESVPDPKGGGSSTRVTVRYSYEAAGEQKGMYRFSKDVRSSAEELAESLPGTAFSIRYNPARVGESVVLLADRPD